MSKKRIYLSPPSISQDSKQALYAASEGPWIAPAGPNLKSFEDGLAAYTKSNSDWLVVNSGTAAMHLAMRMLGVTHGDTVLCQSFTFVASVAPAVQLGAKVVFIGSEPTTWNLCPIQLKKALEDLSKKNSKPKAIIAVSLYGMPYQVDKIKAIAKAYNVPVIEDAAEALGSSYKKQACGSFGAKSVLSFNGNKIISTSGGGALRLGNNTDRERALYFATQAKEEATYYSHSELGYNYRMSNLLAAIGASELKTLEKKVAHKRAVHLFYKRLFKDNPRVMLQEEPNENFSSNFWLNCLVFNSKNETSAVVKLIAHLESHEIESRRLWKPLHTQPVFKDSPYFGHHHEVHLFEQGLCLPSGSQLSSSDKERIAYALNQFF